MKRKLLFITLLMLFCSAVFGQQHWTMNNQGDYTIPMTVYANVSINGVPIKGANYEMAAFHGEELRGVAIPEYDSLLEQYIVTLTVYGKNIGDEISFKLFDPTIGDDGEELETDFKVGFRNDPVGQPIFPQSIDFYEPYFDFNAPSSVENYMGFGCAVKIDGVEQNRPNLEIAAFKENGEVCGCARSQALVGTNIYIFPLPIYAQNGETISFKLFDPTIGEDGDVLSTDYTIKCNVNYDSEAEIVYIDFKNNAVAQIGNNYYATLQEALKAITSDSTLDILTDITIDSDWDCRYTGAKIEVPVTINGNGKTIKFTGKIYDANWNTLFRFENVATVKNLTLDASSATDIQRGITFKKSVTVDNCTLIGNGTTAKYAVIVGEGAAGTDIGEVTANITNSTFENWIKGVTDNMNGQDMNVFAITGCTFDNADVLISAKETVTFTGNDMSSNSYVNISSYSVPNEVAVTAKENTNLAANTETEYNQIAAPLAKINAQDGFLKPVAEAGGQYYVTLQGAVDGVADSGTITLLSDIELAAQDAQELFKPAYNRESYCGVYIPDDKTVVLELNGKTVSYLDTKYDVDNVMVMNLGNLTINDNSAEKTGKITYKPVAGSSQYAKFYSTIFNCGTLTVNAGTIENTAEAETDVTNAVDNHSRLSHEYGNNSILIVNGGTLSGAYYYAIRQYTHYFEGVQNRVVINDGNINGGIYMQHGDNWYYANAESNRLNVDCYLEIKGGNINVNTTSDAFGKIKSRLNNPDNNAFGLNISGGTINVPVELLVQRGVYYENGVSGATVSAETPGTRNAEWLAKNDGFVQGGTFSQIGGEEEHTTNLELFLKKGYKLEQNENDTYGVVVDPDYGMVAKIGETRYATLSDAFAAAAQTEELTTIELLPVTIEEGTVELPATLKNVTVKGAEGAVLKDMTIMAHDGNSINYEGITFDGVVFENSCISVTGWRNNGAVVKNFTVTNCVFKNLDNTTNVAPVHFNMAATEPVNGFTFTNNVIDGATGGSKSGVYAQVTGETVFTNNVINNVSFRPYVIQLTTDDGIDDEFTVTGNTFSGSADGRAQGLGNNDEGTDVVKLTVSNNIFKGITNAQQICYWNFNEATTTATLEKNYYDIDVMANPDRIYYNSPAQNITDLSEMGIFPIYKGLKEDGTINEESLFNPVAYVGTVAYETLAEAFAGQDGTIVLLKNIELTQGLTVAADKIFTLDLNGKVVSGVSNTAATSAVITNNGNLTVKTSVEGGKITSKANNPDQNSVPAYANNTITNCGVLTLLSGTIENSTEQGLACFPIDNNSTVRDAVLNINGGTVTGRGAIRQFANSNTNKNEVNVTAGTVTGTSYAIWVQNPGSGDPKASLNIEGGELSKILMSPNANFEASIKGGTISEVAIWEPDATNPGRNPSGFITGGTFSTDVTDFCAEGFIAKVNTEGTYDVRFADYIVLPTGMNESNYETLFGTNTVTDGINYYATLQTAVEAVVGQADAILYCKPGADVGVLQHAPVTNTLTVYGNDAYVSGSSERDFDLGNTDPNGPGQGQSITADMTLTVKHLDGCGAWGTKSTEHTVNLVFENCDNMGKIYITGQTGILNITMTDCAFEGVIAEALYSNADGNITLTNVDFSNLNKAVNLNHKAAGTQTVTMTGCTFTGCGNDVSADQIPVRVLTSVPGGKSELTVENCTFTGTPEDGADILLDYGVGITTATVSNTVAYVVVEREANKEPEETTTSAAQTYTFDNRPYVAEVKVGEDLYKYKTIADALTAVPDGGTITLINNVTEEFAIEDGKTVTLDMATYTLTGAITPSNAKLTINGGTINNENASYSAIEINAGTLVLNNVKVTSKRHGVRVDGAVTATINGGEYRLSATSGTRHAVNVSGDANVTIKAGTFVGPMGTTMDSGSAVCVQTDATVTIEGGDFSKGKNATLGVSGKMIVKGGTFDQDPSEYVAGGYLCGFNQETERYEVTMGVASVTQNGSTTYYRTLAEAITAVGSGEVVINLHANATLDYNAREAYGTASTTSLTINGNGKTLTLNQKDSDWSSFGLANADAKVVFNNMIIEKTGYGDTSGAWNTHAIIFSSNVEMNDVTVNNSMAVQDGATLNNVTINEANGYYGLWINGNGQTVTMNDGSITATNGGRGIKIADQYVDAPALVTLSVTGTTFNTAKKAAVLVSSTAGAKVTANGCDITDVAEDSINFVWVDEEWAAYYDNVKVYDEATKTQENEESFPIKVYKSDVNGTVCAYFKNLDELFAAKSTQIPLADNYIELRDDVVANNKVDVSYGNNYYYNFGTSVENGVKMTFNYADKWNMLPHFGLGENITMNVPYLQVIGGDISIAGTLNTGYLYLYGTGEGVVIEETGVVNANVSNDKTVQVKGGTVLTVNGKLNTSTLNVWTQDVNNSKLIVSGTDAQVTASHIHAWNGKDGVSSQEIIVESGALLTAEKLQADRGSIVTVDAARLTATTLTLGYEGNIGTLVVKNDGVITNGIVISSVESTVSGPEDLTVTSGVGGYGVNYFNGVYSLVEIEIQETELFKGWNWFSAYVDINGEEGLTKIQNALAGNATLMKSHTAFGTYYNEMWINDGGEGLSSASVTEMYMIQMKEAMTGENKMQLEGNLVNPSEHTIQLNQYWNWIGYPSNESINLENAFNGFTPQNGDRIKSHEGFSQFYGENSNEFGIIGWWGTLNTMTPGLGYMYYRAGEATSFTYNVPADGAKSELRANITADDNYWVPATHRYANNMTMVAMLEGANADNYEVAAFVDGEVRGSARPVYVEPLDAYMFFLTIYGDEVEEMSFRCYDLATGEEYAINDRINYSVDAMLGSIEEPYMFRGTVGIGEATLSEINIYPNPTTTGREISFDATCETVEVFNTLGVKVAEYHYVDTIDAFETAGIYMIRITNNGNVQNCRVVVK